MDSLCAFVTQRADVNTSLTAITTLWSITDFIKRACLTDACANVVRVAVRLRHHVLCVHTKASLSVCLFAEYLSMLVVLHDENDFLSCGRLISFIHAIIWYISHNHV